MERRKESDWFSVTNPLFEERTIKTNSRALLSARESERDGVSSFQVLAHFSPEQHWDHSAYHDRAISD